MYASTTEVLWTSIFQSLEQENILDPDNSIDLLTHRNYFLPDFKVSTSTLVTLPDWKWNTGGKAWKSWTSISKRHTNEQPSEVVFAEPKSLYVMYKRQRTMKNCAVVGQFPECDVKIPALDHHRQFLVARKHRSMPSIIIVMNFVGSSLRLLTMV